MTGRITKLLVGQSYGYIRSSDGRNAFFHRADVAEGVEFNKLEIGDKVTFELVEDAVSGARATAVTRPQRKSK